MIELAPDELAELTGVYEGALLREEGGVPYVDLPALVLPEGCAPAVVDALFSPREAHGYPSRLFFAQQLTTRSQRNWNSTVRICGRSWFAFSWKIDKPAARLLGLLHMHLGALR